MAVGQVVIGVPIALLGSLYYSTLNGLGVWHTLAAYSLIGSLTLLGLLTATAAQLIREDL